MIRRLIEVAPGKWRLISSKQLKAKRSSLPLPYVISDTMDPVEQVDGKFYTSKSQFRAVGKSLGLIEVGNEKLKHNVTRASATREAEKSRVKAIGKAISEFRAGRRIGDSTG